MPTLLDIKQAVANEFGKSNYSAVDTKRDIAINEARRTFYTSKKWNFAKKQATVVFSGGTANFPTMFSEALGSPEVYDGSAGSKEMYEKVSFEDMNYHTQGDRVWSIDYDQNKIVSSEPTATVTMVYWGVPTNYSLDNTQDSTTELSPDVGAITALAKSLYAHASERDEDVRGYWRGIYEKEMLRIKLMDKQNTEPSERTRFNQGNIIRTLANARGMKASIFR